MYVKVPFKIFLKWVLFKALEEQKFPAQKTVVLQIQFK